jgi:hypothetical protein
MVLLVETPDRFFHLTATGWTAVGSIAAALSIITLVAFNWLYLRLTRKQADAAHESIQLLKRQILLANRPFVALHSEYEEEINARLVYAHNQGAGPALDVEAVLTFGNGSSSNYGIGCLAAGQTFQFLIGENSVQLVNVRFSYRSIEGLRWEAEFTTLAGSVLTTNVEEMAPPETEGHNV